jgi:hypothetical protein
MGDVSPHQMLKHLMEARPALVRLLSTFPEKPQAKEKRRSLGSLTAFPFSHLRRPRVTVLTPATRFRWIHSASIKCAYSMPRIPSRSIQIILLFWHTPLCGMRPPFTSLSITSAGYTKLHHQQAIKSDRLPLLQSGQTLD